MSRHRREADPEWGDDEWSDDEWSDDDDGPDDQSETTDCIQCGAEIYDDASRCPICAEYQVGDRTLTAWQGRPLWWRVGGLLGIIAVLLGLLTVCF